MNFDWIKRAWRGWFGPKVPANWPHTQVPSCRPSYDEMIASLGGLIKTTPVACRPEYLDAAREATIAQKNVRLASIARTRGKLKDEIARLKRNKKRHSHLQAELARLTRLELELESGK